MGLIVALIIGGIIGWLAAAVTGRDEGMFGSIAIGVVGSIIGGLIAGLFGSHGNVFTGFSWSSLLWSFIGAVILVAILNSLQYRYRPHRRM